MKAGANPEKEKHLRAALAEERVLAFLYRNQDRAKALEALLPPEKFVTAYNRRVYKLLLGKIRYAEVSLADFSQELIGEEAAEFTRFLAETAEVPSQWKDVEAYARIIKTDGGFSDPAWVREASKEDIQRRIQALRDRKA